MAFQGSTRFVIHVGALCLAGLFSASFGCAQDADSLRIRGLDALNSGRYDEARRFFENFLETHPPELTVSLGFARTFEAAGEYERGLEAIDAELRRHPNDASLHCSRGRLLTAVGRYEEAASAYAAGVNQQADLWTCRADLADLLANAGQAPNAARLLYPIYDSYKRGQLRTVEALTAAGRAAAALEQFRDANEAFRTAHQIASTDVANLYRWAELFRVKYNAADARRTYEEALEADGHHVQSLIGLARTFNDFERQEELAQTALGVNPKSVGALDLLAELRILDGQLDDAEALAQRALSTNPNSVSTLAQLASISYLRGDTAGFSEIESRALSINPSAGSFYLTVAENLTRRFRYPDAVELTSRAIQVNPANLQAHAELGMSLLRLGRRSEARRHLEVAYENDPYNLFASNTLTYLDATDQFVALESPHVRVLIHPDDQDVLGPLILEVAEAALDSLQSRYPYTLRDKLLVEAYGDADDFAVRIAGVPHRGLLGVSFGDVVAVNTPMARSGEPYNWARTLWHEIAHTMAIGVSSFHVPRWFTEGLSVYEERRGRPEWGRDMDLTFLRAYRAGRLPSLQELDRGFTRPEFPGQIILSYYHAGEAVRFIAEHYGFDAVTQILRRLGAGESEDEAFVSAIGLTRAEVDRVFREDLERRSRALSDVLASVPDTFSDASSTASRDSVAGAVGGPFPHLQEGNRQLEHGNQKEAEQAFKAALEAYPDYVGPGNAYERLAAIYRSQNRTDELIQVLTGYLQRAELDADASMELSGLLLERGDREAARSLLERSLYVVPYNIDAHDRLADLYRDAGLHEQAITHHRAVLALEPPDRAIAYFELARSLQAGGRQEEALRTVLQSLEIAPGFRDAQKLLLEIAE